MPYHYDGAIITPDGIMAAPRCLIEAAAWIADQEGWQIGIGGEGQGREGWLRMHRVQTGDFHLVTLPRTATIEDLIAAVNVAKERLA